LQKLRGDAIPTATMECIKRGYAIGAGDRVVLDFVRQ
jgi:hypothetical protein